MSSLHRVFFLLHIIWFISSGDAFLCPPTCNRLIDTAIVGAGTAGTYAAYRLRKQGVKIELFEYSNRIGGRTHTTTLENVPDLNFDLGAMRFVDNEIKALAQELNLTVQVFPEGFGRPGKTRFNLRGVSLTAEEVRNGNVPYDLSEEEKANQHRLFSYYLEKLTGYKESTLSPDEYLKLRLRDNGPELYKLTFEQALSLVATPEGKEFAKALAVFTSVSSGDVTSLYPFLLSIPQPDTGEVLTLKEGMGALPLAMAQAFQNHSNKWIRLNRRLISITGLSSRAPVPYKLQFEQTYTKDGITHVMAERLENICARRIILALPQTALTLVDWSQLRRGKVSEALHAVIPVPLSKVYMTFPNCWWRTGVENPAYVMTTDTEMAQMYDWKQSSVSGDCAMLASYAENDNTRFQERINNIGNPIPGSAAGLNVVREGLKNSLLDHFSKVFGISREKIPEPISAVARFWHAYPIGGGVTLWKAGQNSTEVGKTIRRPYEHDNIFIVGSDHAFYDDTAWIKGALRTVNEVIDNYF